MSKHGKRPKGERKSGNAEANRQTRSAEIELGMAKDGLTEADLSAGEREDYMAGFDGDRGEVHLGSDDD